MAFPLLGAGTFSMAPDEKMLADICWWNVNGQMMHHIYICKYILCRYVHSLDCHFFIHVSVVNISGSKRHLLIIFYIWTLRLCVYMYIYMFIRNLYSTHTCIYIYTYIFIITICIYIQMYTHSIVIVATAASRVGLFFVQLLDRLVLQGCLNSIN